MSTGARLGEARRGPKFWPVGGAWVVAATSTAAGWPVAVAALAVAAPARVAVLRLVGRKGADAADDLLRRTAATYVEVDLGGGKSVRADDVVQITRALARTHRLVLVG